jgi:hypothetical protein
MSRAGHAAPGAGDESKPQGAGTDERIRNTWSVNKNGGGRGAAKTDQPSAMLLRSDSDASLAAYTRGTYDSFTGRDLWDIYYGAQGGGNEEEQRSDKFVHPLVGKPLLGTFYCRGAALCICPCLPHQRRIRERLIRKHEKKGNTELNLMGTKKDPLDCYHVNPNFTVLKWIKASLKDRRVRSLLVTMTFTFCCVYFNCVMQVVAQRRADRFLQGPIPLPKYNTSSIKKLPDIGFDIFKHLNSPDERNFPDRWLGAVAGMTFIRFSLTPMRLTIFRRWWFCLGMLFLLRGVTIIVTLLPNPFYDCVRKGWGEGLTDNMFIGGLNVMFGNASTCADVLYSGHTLNITLLALVWHQYTHVVPLMNGHVCPARVRRLFRTFCCCGQHVSDKSRPRHMRAFAPARRLTVVKAFVWCCCLLEYYFIVATHFHYTVDVIIGMMFTVITWSFYHHGVLNVIREPESDRVCCERVISWAEAGAEDVIELNQDIMKMRQFIKARRERSGSERSSSSISIEIPGGPDASKLV